MAHIGKAESPKKSEKSIDELRQEFLDEKKLREKTISGIKDFNDISSETKSELRAMYTRGAQIAKKLSERVPSMDEQEGFAKAAEALYKRAAKFGSTIKHDIPNTTFDDIKGLDEVKDMVKSFIFMLEHPDIVKYYKMDGNLGMLMYGAPGTGKTMFAEAVAHEMNLPLFVVTPADIFKSYVGASEQAVKDLFEDIDACPDGAVLFVDECESIFSKRNEDTKDYKAAVTTELLQRMNGFGVDGSQRIMIAATNRPDVIDPAYLRYKRFSYQVHITPPDATAIRAIFEGKLKGIELASDVDINYLVNKANCERSEVDPYTKMTVTKRSFYSAADLCGIIEEACRLAVEQIQKAKSSTTIPLTRAMFDKAFDKVQPSISEELLMKYEKFKEDHAD